jgi:hypothetical protein
MRFDAIAALVAVAAGAAVTTLVAKQQLGDAVNASLSSLGVPSQVIGALGNGDPLAAIQKVSPDSATRLETAWGVSVVGGAVAAVAAYVIVDSIMG